LKDAGYFDGVYGEAFDGFLKMTNSPWPAEVDDPVVGLFLLIVDLAINPTAGFPLDIESFENLIIDVDPGIRFMRLSQSVRDHHPELLGRITEYSRQEYMSVADVLTKTCGYDHPVYPAVRRCFAARSRAVCRPRSHLSCAEHKRRHCGHLCSSNSSRGS
jgi:hypothetical protein